jgi:hypothetical protein
LSGLEVALTPTASVTVRVNVEHPTVIGAPTRDGGFDGSASICNVIPAGSDPESTDQL